MPAVFEHYHVVSGDEIDALGHANNVAYVEWMQSAAVAHSAAQGWPSERYQDLTLGWVVRSHRIEYLQPAFIDEQIVVRTWVATMKKATSLRRYHILRPSDAAHLASAETLWAFVNYTTGHPTRIPREIADAFELVEEVGQVNMKGHRE